MVKKPLKQKPDTQKKPQSFLDRLNNLIDLFEKERFTYLTAFLWVLLLSVLRMWTEAIIFDYPYKNFSYEYFFYNVHITSFFLSVFLGGVLILKFFTKRKTLKIINLACVGFTLALIPPVLDILFNIGNISYTYLDPLNFYQSFMTYFASQGSAGGGGIGIAIELFAIVGSTSLYVLLVTKSFLKFLMNFITFLVFILFMGSPLIIFLIGEHAGALIQPIAIIRYTLLSIVFLLLLLRIEKKGLLKSFVKSMRLLTTAHFILMAIIGVLIAGMLGSVGHINMNLQYVFEPTFYAVFTGNIGTFILTLLIIFFGWQFTIMLNHVYDEQIDRVNNTERVLPKNFINPNNVKRIALIFAIISFGFSFALGVYSIILVIIGIIFGWIYSAPPFRLRDSIFSTTIIGLGSMISYFIGYVTPAYVKVMHGEFAGEIMRIYPEFTSDSLVIGLVIFIALTIGPLIKDYKDYEGDKKTGVKNLFTIYGLEKGVTVTSILLPIPFLCLLILFNTIIDIAVIVPLGLIAGIVFKTYKKTQLIFALYFPLILYCLLRWFEIIVF